MISGRHSGYLRLRRGAQERVKKTILFVSHDLDEALTLADGELLGNEWCVHPAHPSRALPLDPASAVREWRAPSPPLVTLVLPN